MRAREDRRSAALGSVELLVPMMCRGVPNWAPTVDQLLGLAGRAGGKVLRSAEVATLKSGIEGLAAAAASRVPGAPARPVRPAPAPVRVPEAERLLAAALRLYAGCYGLSVAQAEAEVRAEAGL